MYWTRKLFNWRKKCNQWVCNFQDHYPHFPSSLFAFPEERNRCNHGVGNARCCQLQRGIHSAVNYNLNCWFWPDQEITVSSSILDVLTIWCLNLHIYVIDLSLEFTHTLRSKYPNNEMLLLVISKPTYQITIVQFLLAFEGLSLPHCHFDYKVSSW